VRLNKCPHQLLDTLKMFIRMTKLVKRLDISESTIRRMIDRNEFPHSRSLSPGTVRWRIKEIEEWENSRY
jgi:predicted DNA-binding transcriptional regulator AlpA